ncbi:MAG: alpha-L-fucosidase [Phycisphaerae bacterium]
MATPIPAARVAAFEKLGYGLFLHYGLYSLVGRGEWTMHRHHVPAEEYARLAEQFTASEFDGRTLARFAADCGMKYITLTSRHHDGFSLYDTRGLNDFDAPHSPAGRDLIADFVEGCRAENIVPMLYHTTLDWRRRTHECSDEQFADYLDYLVESVEILCTQYGPIGGLWFDGNWSRPEADWQEDRLYAMIRKHQPDAMIINNSSVDARGAFGHPELDAVTYEQGRPEPMDREGMDKYVAAEMCQTMDNHWGIATRDFRQLSPREVITDLCACRRVGANFLMNVGPTAEGAIPQYDGAVLKRVGEWVDLHRPALYDVRPTRLETPGRDFVLKGADGRLFLFVHDLTVTDNQNLDGVRGAGLRTMEGLTAPVRSVRWLDNDERLDFTQDADKGHLAIACTDFPYGEHLVVRVAEITLQ